MKTRFTLFVCLALALLLQACHEDPYLTVSPDSLSFPQDGGSQTVHISANYAWTASVSGSGFSVSPASGEGDATLTVTASAASATDVLSGTLTVQSEGLSASVKLSQEAKSAILVGNAATIPGEGGTYSVTIQYNTDFSVEIEPSAKSWITFNGTKALTSGWLEFQFAANDGAERSGKVTVKDKAGKVSPITLTFTQEEKKVLEVGETMSISPEGGSYEVDIRYNTDFSVEVEKEAESWITFVRTKAVTSGKLEFQFAANTTGEERTGKVTVKDKSGKVSPVTLTFTQTANNLIAIDNIPEIPAQGGSYEVDIQYNTDFTVEIEKPAQSWISFVKTKALQSGKLEFLIAANDSETARTGKVTVKDKSGKIDHVAFTFTQAGVSPEVRIRRVLMDFFNALDGPNWKNKEGWGTDQPLNNWYGVSSYGEDNKLELYFHENNLKGEVPASIADLGDVLTGFTLFYESGVSGEIPASVGKLVNLRMFNLVATSITSVPDVFADLKSLQYVQIAANESLSCPLPYSIGDAPSLTAMMLNGNRFTGELPASWARLGRDLFINNNCLTGKIPQAYVDSEYASYFLSADFLWQKDGYGFDVTDIDIPGEDAFWPKGEVEDIYGKVFTFRDVVKSNRYTVYVSWAPWCPFSAELMPQLRDYYAKYRQDGLEVIATIQADNVNGVGIPWTDLERQKQEVEKYGYDQWYNFLFTDYITDRYLAITPAAEVYDSDGYVLFSYKNYVDPVRDRFNKSASIDLISFLESVLGPAETPDTYTSIDYSRDGEVMTLQKATVGKGIDIVLMGDGYTDRDMGKGGLYEKVMKESMEEFFAIEPYKTFRNRFNVYAVKVVSPNGRIGEGYSTALSSYFGVGSFVGGNDAKCYEYAKKVPGIDSYENLLVAVMVNTRRHAGTTIMYADGQTCVARVSSFGNDASVYGATLRHEAGGHGFAFLADEYFEHRDAAPADHIAYYNEVYDKYGWFSNVDFTNDPDKVRWSVFLSDSRYKGEVGIYEGAALYEKGAWRPTVNSMMRDNFEYFNAPSRWAIYQQILRRSGEEPSFEKFLEYDAVNRSAAATAARPPLKAAANRRIEHTAPPVIVR